MHCSASEIEIVWRARCDVLELWTIFRYRGRLYAAIAPMREEDQIPTLREKIENNGSEHYAFRRHYKYLEEFFLKKTPLAPDIEEEVKQQLALESL